MLCSYAKASLCSSLIVDMRLKKLFLRSVFFYSKSGVGPRNESKIGIRMKAFAMPTKTIPSQSLKKTMKKYDLCANTPIRITASKVEILPWSTLDPMRLRPTRAFQTRYFSLGMSRGASTSMNDSVMWTE